MSQGKILHLFGWDKKFVLPFRNLIHEHFADGRHQFIVYGSVEQGALPLSADTVIYPSLLRNFFGLSRVLHDSKRIILHGLFSSHLLYILALQPWLLKKCYWVIWGGDLYGHENEKTDWRWRKTEYVRRLVIKRIGNFVTQVKGDYELAKRWYKASGRHYECFVYPSNLYIDYEIPPKTHDTINIQVGNSAAPSNNHIALLKKLTIYKNDNIKIYAPLSYGPSEYARMVSDYGMSEFGEKFVPLMDFMPLKKYLEFLASIDIAIFNHRRQQAMGNATSLLGLGKKVYLRTDVTPWDFYQELGVSVFNIDEFELSRLDDATIRRNKDLIACYFNISTLKDRLGEIFK